MPERDNPDTGSQPRMDPGLAALLRKAADGELAYEEMVALRMYMDANASAEDRVEFERQLRAACRRTMSDVVAPQSLRDQVQRLMASSREPELEDPRSATFGSPLPVVVRRQSVAAAQRAPYRIASLFWSVRGVAAAVVLLAVGYGAARLLDRAATFNVKPESATQDRFVRADLTGYLSSQIPNADASGPSALDAKVQSIALQRTTSIASEWLQQRPLTPDDDDSGVAYIGGERATMPGAGRAFHFRYRVEKTDIAGKGSDADAKSDPDHKPGDPLGSGGKSQVVSVFVQQDRLDMALTQDTTYGVMGPVDNTIWVTRHNGLVYYILGESRWAVRRTILALGLPEASNVIKAMPESESTSAK